MWIRLSPFSDAVPFCDCGLSKKPSYTTKLFICGMVRSSPARRTRIELIWIVLCQSHQNTYRSACDKRRLISQMVDRLPFYAEPDSRARACVRTMLCRGRLVGVIHECKSPKRMALPPIWFHRSRRIRTNFSCRFSADPLRNRCNSTRSGKQKKKT